MAVHGQNVIMYGFFSLFCYHVINLIPQNIFAVLILFFFIINLNFEACLLRGQWWRRILYHFHYHAYHSVLWMVCEHLFMVVDAPENLIVLNFRERISSFRNHI